MTWRGLSATAKLLVRQCWPVFLPGPVVLGSTYKTVQLKYAMPNVNFDENLNLEPRIIILWLSLSGETEKNQCH